MRCSQFTLLSIAFCGHLCVALIQCKPCTKAVIATYIAQTLLTVAAFSVLLNVMNDCRF